MIQSYGDVAIGDEMLPIFDLWSVPTAYGYGGTLV